MVTPIPDNRASFRLGDAADNCDGHIQGGGPDLEVVGVVSDSRSLVPGNLYVALRGEHHDGHDFLPQVAAAGAAAALVERGRAHEGLPAIEVASTLSALGDLAAAHRQSWLGELVAITGSAGKTTTKELTAAALSAGGATVMRTAGNLNNLIGVPMTLLCLEGEAEMAVVELGTNAPGEIARLSEIARPDVAVVTSVAMAHTQGLGSLQDVAREKTSIFSALAGGTAVFNADDEALVAQVATMAPTRSLSFGRAPGADVRLSSWELGTDLRCRCCFQVRGKAIETSLRLLGAGPAIDAAAALAVVLALQGEADLEDAAVALSEVEPMQGRMCALQGPGGAVVIDDSYNSNPASAAASLEATAALAAARHGRTLLVLGDMKELGEASEVAHRELGLAAVAAGASLLLCCGPEMLAAHAAATPSADIEVQHLEDPMDAVELVRARLRASDVVLVKGSRSMAMERVADALSSEGDR